MLVAKASCSSSSRWTTQKRFYVHSYTGRQRIGERRAVPRPVWALMGEVKEGGFFCRRVSEGDVQP